MGCKIAVIDEENYLKDKPPKKVVVKIRIELLEILELGEVERVFRNQFRIYLSWFDSRIVFHNLHDNQGLNTLVEEEKKTIWTPLLIFDNTNKKIQAIADRESNISVKRKGNSTTNTIDNIDNVFIYNGIENSLHMDRVYDTRWYCIYFYL